MTRWIIALLLCAAVPTTALAHDGHTHRAAWDACKESTLGAACSWQDGAKATYRGTCREMHGALMCVRNQPIVPAPAPAEGTKAPQREGKGTP